MHEVLTRRQTEEAARAYPELPSLWRCVGGVAPRRGGEPTVDRGGAFRLRSMIKAGLDPAAGTCATGPYLAKLIPALAICAPVTRNSAMWTWTIGAAETVGEGPQDYRRRQGSLRVEVIIA